MAELATLTKHANVGVVTLNNPPVNALSHALRLAMQEAFMAAIDDPSVQAIVLHCDGRTFVAGADIREFDIAPLHPDVHEVVEWVGNCPKPVTVALHGTALGGGVELALACHYRVATPDAKVGFPEVGLGILPGAGGTQRLPRLVGVRAALEMIVGGAPIPASRAMELGLLDELIEGDLLSGALKFAERALAEARPWGKVSDRPISFHEPQLFGEFEQRIASTSKGFLAPFHCIRAIRAAAELPFDEGLRLERELFFELVNSPQSKAQRHAFFGEREVARSPLLPADVRPSPIRRVAVVGGAQACAAISSELSGRGVPTVAVSEEELVGADLEDPDLVILLLDGPGLSRALEQLDSSAAPHVIFAINSLTVNLSEVAARTNRPELVVGLHFDGRRLMEVVKAPTTSLLTCAKLMGLSKPLRRVPILEQAAQGSASSLLRAANVSDGEQELSERKIDAMINVGARLLDDCVLARPLEFDMIAIHAHRFPVYLGGPLFHADQIGPKTVVDRLLRYSAETGDDGWQPAPLLSKLAEEGLGFYS